MSHRHDPRQIVAKFDSNCNQCGRRLRKGTQIYYWPLTKTVKCGICGERDFLEFIASLQDEQFYNHQS